MTDPSAAPPVDVRTATEGDELDVRRVLDAAMLESDSTSDAVARGNAFVAVADGDRVVGALVLVPFDDVALPGAVRGDAAVADGVGMHVDAVAVGRRRRGQGIGRALVAAALDREQRLTVAFDPRVREFYDALDFAIVADPDAGGDVGDDAGDDAVDRVWAERSLDE